MNLAGRQTIRDEKMMKRGKPKFFRSPPRRRFGSTCRFADVREHCVVFQILRRLHVKANDFAKRRRKNFANFHGSIRVQNEMLRP